MSNYSVTESLRSKYILVENMRIFVNFEKFVFIDKLNIRCVHRKQILFSYIFAKNFYVYKKVALCMSVCLSV